MTIVWTILILAIIYCGIGIGAELINTPNEDVDFEFNWVTAKRILKWPKRIFSSKKE